MSGRERLRTPFRTTDLDDEVLEYQARQEYVETPKPPYWAWEKQDGTD